MAPSPGGEQDYDDAFGVTSPEPGGDKITGGTLTVNSTTGQGTLTLITNNTKVGVSGTEKFGVQFVNAKHALIMQFDGTATSSGSMDVQSLPSTPSGGFALTLSGVDSSYNPNAIGGVFTLTGTSLAGKFDQNDSGTVTTDQAFTGSISTPDSLGRGTLSITGDSSVIKYYIVGPEAIRIIDVDTTKAFIGSAFGQGGGSFNNASLGSSVLALAGNPWVAGVGAIGQFSTSNTSNATADFSGVGDDNDLVNGKSASASAVSGTYSIASSGYGSLKITSGLDADVSTLGVYMTNPALNLNDPNNSSGGGGALVLDLDDFQAGVGGIITPQTDTTTAHFTSAYAVAAQDFNNFSPTICSLCEFDMISHGTMTSGSLSLTGMVSDPFTTLTSGTTSSGDTFKGTPPPDGSNPGRYSNFSIAATVNSVSGGFEAVIYQASGEQLYWLEVDPAGVWVGPLEQQGTLTGVPSVEKTAANPQLKQRP